MRKVLEKNGLEVYAYGSDINPKMKKGTKVKVPQNIIEKHKKLKDRKVRVGDSMYERVYESDNITMYGPSYDSSSLADYFPVDRRSGFATSLKLYMERAVAPSIATQVCCATDIPLISVEKNLCTEYTGFVNLVVAADTCMWDSLAADEQGVDLLDDEYLPKINDSLTIASNKIIVEGDEENNVLGLKNNPYITTVVVSAPSVVNPVVSFRQVTQFIETRDNSIVNLSNTFNKTYTVMIPMSLAMSLANSTVSFANNTVSLISVLAGATGLDANDFAVPKFNIIAMEHLENHWNDGVSDVAYMFANDSNSFASSCRWWKPFSFLDLGGEQKGLREQSFFGARVGSLEFLDLTKVVRIVIPNS